MLSAHQVPMHLSSTACSIAALNGPCCYITAHFHAYTTYRGILFDPLDYMKEVEIARSTDAEEQRAREQQAFGDVRAKGIVAVMKLFNKEGQLPMYYSGGLRLLADDMRLKRET